MMKKILGYSFFYLIGLMCVFSMMYRVDNLEKEQIDNTVIYNNFPSN